MAAVVDARLSKHMRRLARGATLIVAAIFLTSAMLGASRWCEAFASAPVGAGAGAMARLATRGAAGSTLQSSGSFGGVLGAVAATAVVAGAAAAISSRRAIGKTTMRYTTQTILPSFSWLKAGFKSADLDGGRLEVVCLAGVDVVIGKSGSGKLFAVADKCPPIGSSLCVGGDIEGDLIVDSQYGSAFNVFTGYPEEWCTSPPILGGLIGSFMGGPQALAVFECRASFFGGDVEVLVDTNAKRSYEANYWKGLLDAQGKNDGTYY